MTDLGFRPHGHRVLVQTLPPPKQVGAIHLPQAHVEKRVGEAIIVAIGKGVAPDFAARVGDHVYTDRFQGTEVTIKGTKFVLHEPENILAVLEHA